MISDCVSPETETGINDLAASGITIFPTITEGDIQIKVASESKALTVYAISATEVVLFYENLKPGFNTLRIDSPNGLYLFQVFEGSTFIGSHKIIKIN